MEAIEMEAIEKEGMMNTVKKILKFVLKKFDFVFIWVAFFENVSKYQLTYKCISNH